MVALAVLLLLLPATCDGTHLSLKEFYMGACEDWFAFVAKALEALWLFVLALFCSLLELREVLWELPQDMSSTSRSASRGKLLFIFLAQYVEVKYFAIKCHGFDLNWSTTLLNTHIPVVFSWKMVWGFSYTLNFHKLFWPWFTYWPYNLILAIICGWHVMYYFQKLHFRLLASTVKNVVI